MRARTVFLAVSAIVVCAAGASADVIVQQQSFDPNLYSLNFSQFNPGNGALQGVTLTLNSASLNPMVNVTNTSASPQSGDVTISVNGLLHAASLPGQPLESVLIGSETIPVTLAPFASTELVQPLGATWNPSTAVFNSSDLLSDFTGTGSIRFDAFFGQGYMQVSSDNASISATELGPVLGDSASLEYTYAIQPEPASIVLMGVGGLMLAGSLGVQVLRRRHIGSRGVL